MNLIDLNYSIDEIIFNSNNKKSALQSAVNFGIIPAQSQKTTASREKLNLIKANDSTPQNRAFFVRNIRTPKEYADFVFNLNPIILSMVERNGQPLAVGCLPLLAVSHPVTFYRQTVRSLAVVLINQIKDTAEMIYKFLCVNRTQAHFNLCVISLESITEEQARLSLCADYRVVATVARINLKNFPQTNRTLAALPTLSTSVVMEVAHG